MPSVVIYSRGVCEARELVAGLFSRDLGFIVEMILIMMGALGDAVRCELEGKSSVMGFLERHAEHQTVSWTLRWLHTFDRACWGMREYGCKSNALYSIVTRYKVGLIETYQEALGRYIRDGIHPVTNWPFPRILFCPKNRHYDHERGVTLLKSMHDIPRQRRNPKALHRVIRLFDDVCNEFTGVLARRRAWYALGGGRYGHLDHIPERHRVRLIRHRGRWVLEQAPKTRKERREHNRQKAIAIDQNRRQRAEEKRRSRRPKRK